MCKVYTGYHGASEIEYDLCACTVANPRAKARGLSLRTGTQTILYLAFDLIYLYLLDDGKLYCNSSWDEYSCWPRTLAGTFAIIPCPGYLPGIDDSGIYLWSTQRSIKFFMLINVKMRTTVGILTVMSGEHSILGLSEPKNS